MSAAHLPLPEPPDHELADVLEHIRYTRLELAEAHRVVALLGMGSGSRSEAYSRIESAVAERRAELWAVELSALEQRARDLGWRP